MSEHETITARAFYLGQREAEDKTGDTDYALLLRDLEREETALRSEIAPTMKFHPAHAVCILLCRDALIRGDVQSAYHWLYTLDSKQVPHDPFKPWGELLAIAGDAYKPETEAPNVSATPNRNDAVQVPLMVFNAALNYIRHVGANHTMRGEPHPQQWIVDGLERCHERNRE